MIDYYYEKSKLLKIVILGDKTNVTNNISDLKLYDKIVEETYSFMLRKALVDINNTFTNSLIEWFDERYAPFFKHYKTNKLGETVSERPMMIYVDIKDDNIKIVGVCLMKRKKKDQKISIMYVDPKHRNKGIAQSMLLKSHEILNLETSSPYIYINEEILKSYPYIPHIIVKCGFDFSHKEGDKNLDFYFKMNKLYGDFLNKYRKAIMSIDGNIISCKL